MTRLRSEELEDRLFLTAQTMLEFGNVTAESRVKVAQTASELVVQRVDGRFPGDEFLSLFITDGNDSASLVTRTDPFQSSFIDGEIGTPAFATLADEFFFQYESQGENEAGELWVVRDRVANRFTTVADGGRWRTESLNAAVVFESKTNSGFPQRTTHQVYLTDGTADGTVDVNALIPSAVDVSFAAEVNDTMFFVAVDQDYGRELWSAESTSVPDTIARLGELPPGSGSSVDVLTSFNGQLLLSATTGDGVSAVWRAKSDGDSVDRVVDVGANSQILSTHSLANRVILEVQNADGSISILATDGTEQGTVSLLSNLTSPVDVHAGAKRIYFQTKTENQDQLWTSDGTVDGTAVVLDGLLSEFHAGTTESYAIVGTALYRLGGMNGDTVSLSSGNGLDIVESNSNQLLFHSDAGWYAVRHDAVEPQALATPFSESEFLIAAEESFFFYSVESNSLPQSKPAGRDTYHFWSLDGDRVNAVAEWTTNVLVDWKAVVVDGEYTTSSWIEDAWFVGSKIVAHVNSPYNYENDSGYRAFASIPTTRLLPESIEIIAGNDFVLQANVDLLNANYRWDFNNDGEFNDSSGKMVTVPWSQITSLLDEGSFELGVRVETEDGASEANAVVSVVVGGDANGDGVVSFADFLVLSGSFGMDSAERSDGDFDGDGEVGFSDFLVLSSNFGKAIEDLV